MNLKVTLLSSLLASLILSSEGFSQEEEDLVANINAQLPEASTLTNTEELQSFLAANMGRLDETTVSALEQLAQSKSRLANQILASRALDKKLERFKSTLPVETSSMIDGIMKNGKTVLPVNSASFLKTQKDLYLAKQLEAFQAGLAPDESVELVSRLTKFGRAQMSSFGSGD